LIALSLEPARDDGLPVAAEPGAPAAPLVLWRVPDTSGAGGSTQFVDLQRDATVADITRAVQAGLRSIEHIKRYTTIGTAHDQGKTSGVITSGITAELLGIPVRDTGTTTFRPPYTPVAFAALAGRDRGRLFDPERVTALHEWHVAAGAVFEDVGQWKRPRFYRGPVRTWRRRSCGSAPRHAPASASSTAPRSARSISRVPTPPSCSTGSTRT
jgi:sarcosine oxidase subunit alpha